MEDWKQEHLDFYKNLSEQELRIKEQIDQIIAFPLTTVSALTGALYFLVDNTIKVKFQCFTWFETIFVCLSACYYMSFIIGLYFLLKVFHAKNRKYHDFPLATEVNNYQDELLKYFKEWEGEDETVKPKFSKQFNSYVLQSYIEIATHNSKVNVKRAELFYNAREYLIVCAYLFVVISIFSIVKMLFL